MVRNPGLAVQITGRTDASMQRIKIQGAAHVCVCVSGDVAG
jgi:hypothetical protein